MKIFLLRLLSLLPVFSKALVLGRMFSCVPTHQGPILINQLIQTLNKREENRNIYIHIYKTFNT